MNRTMKSWFDHYEERFIACLQAANIARFQPGAERQAQLNDELAANYGSILAGIKACADRIREQN